MRVKIWTEAPGGAKAGAAPTFLHARARLGRLALGLAIFLLVGCGGQTPPKPTQAVTPSVPAASPTAIPTPPENVKRVSYPWPMKHQIDPQFGINRWLPTNPAVYQEMEADFLTYWSWAGYSGPSSFPFSPDPAQIVLLATSDLSSQLQAYAQQISSSGQVVSYLNPDNFIDGQPPQTVQGCTQDGLQCRVEYAFAGATETTLNAQTGTVLSRVSNVIILVHTEQIYSKELGRWQLNTLQLEHLIPPSST